MKKKIKVFLFPLVFSLNFLSSFAQANPRRVLSCDTGGYAYRTLMVYDDGRSYEVIMKAETSFESYYSRPILQSLVSGSYKFSLPKSKCSLKEGLVSCLSFDPIDLSISGFADKRKPVNKTIQTLRLAFKFSEEKRKEINFYGNGPVVVSKDVKLASLSAIYQEGDSRSKLGAQLEFESHMCQFYGVDAKR